MLPHLQPAHVHEQVKEQHTQLKQQYIEEMERFRILAKRMLDQC